MVVKNFFHGIPRIITQEIVETLGGAKGVAIERIISRGQATPAGTWLSGKRQEWVMVLKGRAGLRFHGRAKIVEMGPGDYCCIPAGQRHRVAWTDDKGPTVWLAIHSGGRPGHARGVRSSTCPGHEATGRWRGYLATSLDH